MYNLPYNCDHYVPWFVTILVELFFLKKVYTFMSILGAPETSGIIMKQNVMKYLATNDSFLSLFASGTNGDSLTKRPNSFAKQLLSLSIV